LDPIGGQPNIDKVCKMTVCWIKYYECTCNNEEASIVVACCVLGLYALITAFLRSTSNTFRVLLPVRHNFSTSNDAFCACYFIAIIWVHKCKSGGGQQAHLHKSSRGARYTDVRLCIGTSANPKFYFLSHKKKISTPPSIRQRDWYLNGRRRGVFCGILDGGEGWILRPSIELAKRCPEKISIGDGDPLNSLPYHSLCHGIAFSQSMESLLCFSSSFILFLFSLLQKGDLDEFVKVNIGTHTAISFTILTPLRASFAMTS